MKKPRLSFTRWRVALAFIAIAYVTLCLGMAYNQRAFIYVPMPGAIEPAEAGLPNYTRKHITGKDGIDIFYWESTSEPDAPLLFYFHGNGGGLHQFVPALHYLEEHGYHVIATEYRGYPGSPEGKSETNIVNDGVELVETLHKTHDKQKLIFWGYSLGSGIATQIAARHQPDVLVLEAPFTAVVDRAAEMFPMLPTRYLMRDTYLSRDAIRKLHMPLFIMHGDQDWVVPAHHGKELFAVANEPKTLKLYEGYGHLDLIHSTAYEDALSFINNHAN